MFLEEHNGSYATPYKFNAKELDEETGLYYYGARYLNPKTSLWLSVDPLAEKFGGRSPYEYTFSNPVRLTDPDGRSPLDIIYLNKDGSINRVVQDGSSKITIVDHDGKSYTTSSYKIDRGLVYWNNRNRQVIANIAGYYGRQVGVEGVGATYKKGGLAHYSEDDNGIWIALQGNGSPSEFLNDKHNLQSVLIHENYHKTRCYENTFIGHSNVYLNQIIHMTFKETTAEFKLGMVGSFANHVMNAIMNNEAGAEKLIDSFNKLQKEYKLEIGNQGRGLQATITITENNDRKLVNYKKYDSPSD